MVCNSVQIPVIAAGGIATGRQMLSAMVLGAQGVQMGSRFIASHEASVHANFKNAILNAPEGATQLALKKLTPVRLLKNNFYAQVQAAELKGESEAALQQLLGRGRAKKGMFEGDLDEGELEVGQVCALINTIQPAATIVQQVWQEFEAALQQPLK
jgi:enoyl-[acyl-carrier protein] reductase II